jgi:hypothetical protein
MSPQWPTTIVFAMGIRGAPGGAKEHASLASQPPSGILWKIKGMDLSEACYHHKMR